MMMICSLLSRGKGLWFEARLALSPCRRAGERLASARLKGCASRLPSVASPWVCVSPPGTRACMGKRCHRGQRSCLEARARLPGWARELLFAVDELTDRRVLRQAVDGLRCLLHAAQARLAALEAQEEGPLRGAGPGA